MLFVRAYKAPVSYTHLADGRGVAAAFALGAHAVQMGTRFVLSEECIAHENYKNAVLKAKDRSTCLLYTSIYRGCNFLGIGTKDAAYILCVHVRTFTIFRRNVLPNGASYGLSIDNSADCKSKIPIIKQNCILYRTIF